MKKAVLSFIVISVLICESVVAQLKVDMVAPGKTATGITTVHGDHIALYNPSTKDKHRLILMIEGTGAAAKSCFTIDSCFAEMGYHVISIDYENNVIATACSHSKDSGCFTDYRQEIICGTPVSDKVQVDSVNSIVNRFTKLLLYLTKHDPDGKWDRFLKNGSPDWKQVIAAGHSQGAGHAAFLGKKYQLAGVLIFSGPQDYLVQLKEPAPWQAAKGKTNIRKYISFLHVKDPFNFNYQVANINAMIHRSATDTVMVVPGKEPRRHSQIFVNNIETKSPHGSTLRTEFLPVWATMLKETN